MIYSDCSIVTPSGNKTLLTSVGQKTFDAQSGFQTSTITFHTPRDYAQQVGLTEGVFVSTSVDDYTLPTPYVIESSSWDFVSDDGIPMVEFKGRSIHALGEDAVVLPSAWPNPAPSGHAFQNATAGTILKTLITRAQERNTLLQWDTASFSGAVDSNGVTWPAMADRTYNNGDTLLSVCKALVDEGLVELAFDGFKLKAYVPGTLGKVVPPEKVLFRPGYSLSEGSSERDASEFATDIFAIGEGTAVAFETRPALYSVLGRRRVKFVQYGGITNKDLLGVLAKSDLDRMAVVKQEDSLAVPHTVYQPFTSYSLDDWVTLDRGDGTSTSVKIKQISIQESQNGEFTVGVSLGSLLDSAEEKIQRRLDSITGANAGGGAVPNDKASIKLAPSKPIGLSVTAQPYLDNQQRRKVIAMADWSDVLTYSNGTPLRDIDHYEVSTKAGNATGYSAAQVVESSNAVFSGYDPDTKFQFRVRALIDGLASPWVESAVTTLVDNTPIVLSKPSTPKVSSRWQTLSVVWDGKNADGSWPSLDTLGVEVHLYTVSTFTPSTSTYAGLIQLVPGSRVGGSIALPNLEPKITYYVKLVPIGKQGTPGTASGSAGATTADLAVTPEQVATINSDLSKAKSDLYNPGGTVDLIKTTLTSQIDVAQMTANGKNSVFWNGNAPSDTNTPGKAWGDVWYQYTIADNKTQIIGQWYWYNHWVSTALSETFLPLVNIGVGTYGELDGVRLKAESVQADKVLVQGSVGTTLIADGAITTDKLIAGAITSDKIGANSITTVALAAQSITGDKIDAKSVGGAVGDFVLLKAENIKSGTITATLNISALGAIIAGDVNGAHAELTSSGLRAYTQPVDESGMPVLSVQLGTDGDDIFSITDADGIESASITSDGVASLYSLTTDEDVSIARTDLLGSFPYLGSPGDSWFEKLPWGAIAYGDARPKIANLSKVSGFNPFMKIGFTINPYRMYRFTLPFRYDVTGVPAGGVGRVAIATHYTWSTGTSEPAEPTTSSGLFRDVVADHSANVDGVSNNLDFVWYPADYGGSDSVKVKVLFSLFAGNCQVTPSTYGAFGWAVTVEDIGPRLDDTGDIVVTPTTGTPPAPAKKTYTSTWTASDSWTFYGDGSRDTYGRDKDITRAGYWNSTSGDMKTMCVFNNNATSGEAKTIASALSGGAVLKKAEVFVQTVHWYNSNGGPMFIRQASGSSIPSTLSDSTAKSGGVVKKDFTTRNQGFWVTVPTSWFSATNRAIYFGPANSGWQGTYSHVASHSHSNTGYRPKVRLTYTR